MDSGHRRYVKRPGDRSGVEGACCMVLMTWVQSWILTKWKEKTNSTKLFSDFYTPAVAHTPIHTSYVLSSVHTLMWVHTFMNTYTYTCKKYMFKKIKEETLKKTKVGLGRHFPGHLVQISCHQVPSTLFLPHKPTPNNRENKVQKQKLQVGETTKPSPTKTEE